VITDNRFPYWVYGAQQDSGTAAVASRTDHGEIDARDWATVGGAESGYIAIDSKDANIFYVGDTNGSLTRFDRRTAQAQNITPGRKYRFPWTAPLVSSGVEPGVLYYGSQYLLRTTDGGLNWHEISPDLTGDTRRDKSAAVTLENAKELGYGVLWSIAPSPVAAGLIWVGSDTGLIHVTRDEGKTWSNVTPKGLPEWSNVTHIEASHFDPGTAYAAVDRHTRDDFKPYIYRTRDYGKTWTLAVEGLAEPAHLNAIREDPKRKGLLYAATELGVRVSFDDGDDWQTMQLNLPACSVRDLVVHDNDVVIATHGRGFWILDNMSPLREIGEKTVKENVVLFRPATVVRMNPEGFQGTPFPVEEPKAKNPPDGAAIDYYLKSAPEGEVTLEILKGTQAVRKYSTKNPAPTAARGAQNIADVWIVTPPHFTAQAGMNRFAWDLRYGLRGGMGPRVVPGAYVVRLTAGGHSYTQPLKVIADPRSVATRLELTKQLELGLSILKAIEKAGDAEEELRTFRRQLGERRSAAAATSDAALVSRITALEAEAAKIAGTGGRGRGGRRVSAAGGEATFASVTGEFSTALSISESADRTPPATAYSLFEQANRGLNELLVSWRSLKAKAADLIGGAH
jgi:photosystem II stability/assembly factor-like uncharacterized protein